MNEEQKKELERRIAVDFIKQTKEDLKGRINMFIGTSMARTVFSDANFQKVYGEHLDACSATISGLSKYKFTEKEMDDLYSFKSQGRLGSRFKSRRKK